MASAPDDLMSLSAPETLDQVGAFIEAVLINATLEEKVWMMSGHGFFSAFVEDGKVWGARPYQAGGGCARLGLPAFFFTDGPRGVARGRSTCFPVTMARGATFDVDLERRIGEVIGIESRAQGCNLSGAVCVNLLRHPGWGRAQETYGEDMHHLGEMGAALARGIQTHNVAATVKHFAANSIENVRFTVDVRMSERVLREIYLPHFKRILDAGCMTVMSAYNRVNGEYCGQHRILLTDILRHEWGFDGVVHSDWVMGVHQPYGAAAGLDIENPEPLQFGEKLIEAVRGGQIAPVAIDTACRRILGVLYRLLLSEDPLPAYGSELVAAPTHVALALEAARKSAVLLKNQGQVLPVSENTKIAVAGCLASAENLGDEGSSRVRPPHVVTPLDGLIHRFGKDRVQFVGDEANPRRAADRAADAGLAVVVVGYTAAEEGEYIPGDIDLGAAIEDAASGDAGALANPEASTGAGFARGGDRSDLRLPSDQIELIREVVAANPRTLVVIQAGSAVLVRDWIDSVPAVMQTFYAGMEGGTALAELIAGDLSPSGRLPFTVARDAGDYPFFDCGASEIDYDLWHGYGKFERDGCTPEFYFGHGLSYTCFDYRALKIRRQHEDLDVQVSVTNRGDVVSDEVVQVYVSPPHCAAERWPRYLKGFRRVTVKPGATVTVELRVPIADLAYWQESARTWVIEPGSYTVSAGPSADPKEMLHAGIVL